MANSPLNCHVVSFAKLIRDTEETREVPTQPKTSGDPRKCHVVSSQYLIRDDDSQDRSKETMANEKVSNHEEAPKNCEAVTLKELTLVDSFEKIDNKKEEIVSLKNSEEDGKLIEQTSENDSENGEEKFAVKRKIGRCLYTIDGDITEFFKEIRNSEEKKSNSEENAAGKKKKSFFPKPSKIAKSVRSKLSSVKRCVAKYNKRVGKFISNTGRRLWGPYFKAMLTHYATMFIVISIFLYSDIFTR